jgi:Histidine kinase-like ATPase domain
MPQFARPACPGAHPGESVLSALPVDPVNPGREMSLADLPQFLLPGILPPATRRAWLDAATASAKAREFTRQVLRSWGLMALAEDATIVVSELVTNALRHGSRSTGDAALDGVELVLCRRADLLVCAVADAATEPPLLMDPDPAAETGRGLRVVEALSASWGWTRLTAQCKAVWAMLRVPAPEAESSRDRALVLAAG